MLGLHYLLAVLVKKVSLELVGASSYCAAAQGQQLVSAAQMAVARAWLCQQGGQSQLLTVWTGVCFAHYFACGFTRLLICVGWIKREMMLGMVYDKKRMKLKTKSTKPASCMVIISPCSKM